MTPSGCGFTSLPFAVFQNLMAVDESHKDLGYKVYSLDHCQWHWSTRLLCTLELILFYCVAELELRHFKLSKYARTTIHFECKIMTVIRKGSPESHEFHTCLFWTAMVLLL